MISKGAFVVIAAAAAVGLVAAAPVFQKPQVVFNSFKQPKFQEQLDHLGPVDSNACLKVTAGPISSFLTDGSHQVLLYPDDSCAQAPIFIARGGAEDLVPQLQVGSVLPLYDRHGSFQEEYLPLAILPPSRPASGAAISWAAGSAHSLGLNTAHLPDDAQAIEVKLYYADPTHTDQFKVWTLVSVDSPKAAKEALFNLPGELPASPYYWLEASSFVPSLNRRAYDYMGLAIGPTH